MTTFGLMNALTQHSNGPNHALQRTARRCDDLAHSTLTKSARAKIIAASI
jgi:hypothetical protein